MARVKNHVYKPPYQRYRESDNLGPSDTSWAWWYVSSNGTKTFTVPWSSATVQKRIGEFRQMTDWVTPGFQQLKAEGRIINHPCYSKVETLGGGDNGWKIKAPYPTATYYGESSGDWIITAFGAPSHLIESHVPDSYLTEVATRVRAKLGQRSKVQALTTIAKLRSTLHLLMNPLSGIRKLADLKRGQSKASKAMTIYEAAEASYLEARYAWRVLLNEIGKWEKAAKKVMEDLPETPRETVKSRMVVDLGETQRSVTLNSSGMLFPAIEVSKAHVIVSAGCLAEDFRSSVQDTLGLNLSEIPYTAWDLIPFSFVANWFVNVDKMLMTLGEINTRILAGWTIVENFTTTTRTHSEMIPHSTDWSVVRHPVGAEYRVTRELTRWPVLPNAGLVLRADSFAWTRDLRLLDALSLITQLARGRVGRGTVGYGDPRFYVSNAGKS